MSGKPAWESDDATYPRRETTCDVCGRSGTMKLSTDRREWMCLHAGKCLAEAARRRKEEGLR